MSKLNKNQTMDLEFINELEDLLLKYYPDGQPEFYSKWSEDYSDEVEIKILCYPKLKEDSSDLIKEEA
jgi:hypothetical protein